MALEAVKQTASAEAGSHAEGALARTIESQTARLPSDVFLWGALGSIAAALALRIMGNRETSQFVGQWAPTLLILGVYNKLVKVAGHDRAAV